MEKGEIVRGKLRKEGICEVEIWEKREIGKNCICEVKILKMEACEVEIGKRGNL